jgi:hypothetical protein
MMVGEYTAAELNNLHGTIRAFVRRRLRLDVDPTDWEDWLTLNKDKGGKGLDNVRDLHDATKTNNFLYTALGQNSLAQDMIIKELEQLNEGKDHININQQNVWSPILMKRRKATIHHALAPFNKAELNQKLARSPLCEWIKANPFPSPKQNPKNRLTSQKNENQSTISLFNIIYQRTEENTTVKTAKTNFETIRLVLDDDVDEINEIIKTVCTFAQQVDNKIDAPPSTSNSLMHPKTGGTQSNTTTRNGK